jgi:hypothetical protein
VRLPSIVRGYGERPAKAIWSGAAIELVRDATGNSASVPVSITSAAINVEALVVGFQTAGHSGSKFEAGNGCCAVRCPRSVCVCDSAFNKAII